MVQTMEHSYSQTDAEGRIASKRPETVMKPLLTIDTNSTLLDSRGKLFNAITPEAYTLRNEKSDDLNPLSKGGLDDAKVCTLSCSSESAPSSSHIDDNCNSNDHDSDDMGVPADTLTIGTKSTLVPNEQINVHTISPTNSLLLDTNNSSDNVNSISNAQPADRYQPVIGNNDGNVNGSTEGIPTLNSEEKCYSPHNTSPSSNSISSHPSEPTQPTTPTTPQPSRRASAAREALQTLRNPSIPLPPPITRGASLDSSLYPHLTAIHNSIVDNCGTPCDSSAEEFSSSENASSDGVSDGDGSYFSEHRLSPKSAARQPIIGNRLPPGHGSNGGGYHNPGSQSWVHPNSRGDWSRSSIGGHRNNLPPSKNLNLNLHRRMEESDLSVSSSSGHDGDEGSVSTIGSAYQLSRTTSASNAYRLNPAFGGVGDIFRNSNRPPMMPILQPQGSLNNESNNHSEMDTPPPITNNESIETAGDPFSAGGDPFSLTTTSGSQATNSVNNRNDGNVKQNRVPQSSTVSANMSLVSSSSEELGIFSLQSSVSGDTRKNDETIASVPILPQSNNSRRHTIHNFNNNTNNANRDPKNTKQHRRRKSCYSVGSICSGYKPDNAEQSRQHLTAKTSTQNWHQSHDESDVDTIVSEISADNPNHYHAVNRTRSYSTNGHDRGSRNKGGDKKLRIPIEVKTSPLSYRKSNGGRGTHQSQGGPKNRNSKVSQNMNVMTEKQIMSQSSFSPSRQTYSNGYCNSSIDKLELIDSSPDRKLTKKASNDSTHKNSLSGTFLLYSEDDTDDSIRMAALAANVGGGAIDDRRNIISSSRDRMLKVHPVDSTVHSKIVKKTEEEVSPLMVGNDTSTTSLIQQSSTGSTSHHKRFNSENNEDSSSTDGYKVYKMRWVMLFWMSLLNLLSDWTCYSIAPISVLTKQKFNGTVDPEALVTIFLASNAVATALEPTVLARLGLRRTVVFGAFLLMFGNIIKSGGIPGLTDTTVEGEERWRVYSGFLLVGLSQPLYQCTPALLSSSWFADEERTLATGIALNANQVGIGLSFIVGTTIVASGDDISTYFNLLSILSIVAFVGCYMQFSDAPPTPPSGSARIMRGSLKVNVDIGLGYGMEYVRQTMPMGGLRTHSGRRTAKQVKHSDQGRDTRSSLRRLESFSNGSSSSKQSDSGRCSKNDRSIGESRRSNSSGKHRKGRSSSKSSDHRLGGNSPMNVFRQSSSKHSHSSKTTNRSSSGKERGSRHTRRNSGGSGVHHRSSRNSGGSGAHHRSSRKGGRKSTSSSGGNHIAPSPTGGMESTAECQRQITSLEKEASGYDSIAPSSMMSGHSRYRGRSHENDASYNETSEEISNWHNYDHHSRQRYGEPQQQVQSAYVPGHDVRHYDHREVNWSQREQYHDGNPYNITQNELLANVDRGYNPQERPDSLFSVGGEKMRSYPYSHASCKYGNSTHSSMHPYTSQYQYQMPPSNWHGAEPLYNCHQYRPMTYLERPSLISHLNKQLPPPESEVDFGAEPIVLSGGSTLEIEILDDQVLRSIKACFSRPGFVHAVAAFVVGGVVINTLSTYMDYLVRLGGSDRTSVGLVGFSFQMLIMISGIIVGKLTDRTRAYYCVVLALLVLGAMILAECGIHLDEAEGVALRWSLLGAAVMTGPLQPVATELGVDVAYPLSENTVLVIQQLFSNLLSALFIPFFRFVRDVGVDQDSDRPKFTFSFYLLILIHATVAVFFSSFNGKYERLQHDRKKRDTRTKNKVETGGSDDNYLHSVDFGVTAHKEHVENISPKNNDEPYDEEQQSLILNPK